MREADFVAIEDAWHEDDPEGFAEAGKRAGLDLSLDRLADLQRDTSIPKGTVVSAIAAALAHPAGIAVHGSTGGWSKEVCLAVKHAGHLTIGIKPVAKETVSPAGAWPDLKPWFKDLAKNRARAERWAEFVAPDRVRIPLLRDEQSEQGVDEGSLMRQIVENPHDRGARLVLADYLLEREDVRGDLIRLDLELAELPAESPKRIEIEDKIEALVHDHGKRLAGLAGEVSAEYRLAGGFVDAITIVAATFKKYGAELLQSQPIRAVTIRPYNAAALETLAECPHLARVRALHLVTSSRGFTDVPLAPLHGFHFERLEELQLHALNTYAEDGERFFAKLSAPRLRRLVIVGGYLGSTVLRALAANTQVCSTLEEIYMTMLSRPRGEQHAQAIADKAFADMQLPNLRSVHIKGCWFGQPALH